MAKRKRPKAKADSAKVDVSRPSDQPSKRLAGLHRELDAADTAILNAINRRGEVVQQIGEAKRAENAPVYDPAREAEVVDRLADANTGPLPSDAVRAVFRVSVPVPTAATVTEAAGGSTARASWFTRSAVAELPLSEVAVVALDGRS